MYCMPLYPYTIVMPLSDRIDTLVDKKIINKKKKKKREGKKKGVLQSNDLINCIRYRLSGPQGRSTSALMAYQDLPKLKMMPLRSTQHIKIGLYARIAVFYVTASP